MILGLRRAKSPVRLSDLELLLPIGAARSAACKRQRRAHQRALLAMFPGPRPRVPAGEVFAWPSVDGVAIGDRPPRRSECLDTRRRRQRASSAALGIVAGFAARLDRVVAGVASAVRASFFERVAARAFWRRTQLRLVPTPSPGACANRHAMIAIAALFMAGYLLRQRGRGRAAGHYQTDRNAERVNVNSPVQAAEACAAGTWRPRR